MIRLEDINLS